MLWCLTSQSVIIIIIIIIINSEPVFLIGIFGWKGDLSVDLRFICVEISK